MRRQFGKDLTNAPSKFGGVLSQASYLRIACLTRAAGTETMACVVYRRCFIGKPVMTRTLDLGQRIELHSMDPHCHDISLGLYQREVDGEARYLVHTYSSIPEAAERAVFLSQVLVVKLGLESIPDAPEWLRFGCQEQHPRALKRAFLDLCKMSNDSALAVKPLVAFDKKAGGNLEAIAEGQGVYRIAPEKDDAVGKKRAAALVRGFAKICEMETHDGNRVSFSCQVDHHALIGQLMYRAQNVRASMQEEEMAASRGVLSSPSQQE